MTYDAQWADLSEYLVHFTRDSGDASAYENMLSILSSGTLEARNDFGAARSAAPAATQRCVCFSEIPLHQLKRLADRRSDYGVGFTKSFLAASGAAPVWYPPLGTRTAQAVASMVRAASSQSTADAPALWDMTPFIDVVGRYPNGARFEFEWEREWRLVGNLDIRPADTALLIIPDSLHSAARSFFRDTQREDTGPTYECAFIDPRWDAQRTGAAMSSAPGSPLLDSDEG